ncbi:MAG: cation transporting ATPase C-terminal domain-containing protein, partial [Proteobacteria bacterium]|nr:cation transporting ATPase C-terminal domain-containing protein [Pseudomonadota bacterium]
LQGAGFDAAQSRSAVFIALVCGVLLLILANRELARPLLARSTAANPWLPRMAAGVALMLALVLWVPFLREVMRLAIPHASAAAAALAMTGVVLAWLEFQRAIVRRRASGAMQ